MYISSVETYLPGCNIKNEELGDVINFKPQLIMKLFGNSGRHFSTNIKTGELTANSSDLISLIIKKLIKNNEKGMSDIEFIITSTATPDHLLPTSVNEACYKLGAKNIETYQIIGGCSGAVQALNLARYIIKSGLHSKGMVIGVECSNKFLNIFDKKNIKPSPKEMVNYVLFGDGVGGCIVENAPSTESIEVKDIIYKYTGLDEKVGQFANWKGSRCDFEVDEPMIQEEYKLIEKLVPELTIQTYNELAERNVNNSVPRWFMPPQLSGKMVDTICKKMSMPDFKTLSLVGEIGNCANAALYFQMKEFFDISDYQDEGIAISVESSRWLTSGLYIKKGCNNV